MKLTELDFAYPESLVAQSPARPSRVMWIEGGEFQEINIPTLLNKFESGDVLVLNDTKVIKRRVFSGDLEILFLTELADNKWQVLFPSRTLKLGHELILPEGITAKLVEKGRPQILQTSQALDEAYFQRVAELPLPPYIQKARGERHNLQQDQSWYQTAWAEKSGSLASPTASLHFTQQDLKKLEDQGVMILKITLHVGLGTFLPVVVEDLSKHVMHAEFAEVPAEVWDQIQWAKKNKKQIWALGTTVTRTLESVARNMLPRNAKGDFAGMTDLLLLPGEPFYVVDRLLTNFHQPKSTLLALVAAFSNLQTVKRVYAYAIQHKFRLFSYGDLSVWLR